MNLLEKLVRLFRIAAPGVKEKTKKYPQIKELPIADF
jgi:hypothetical protein